jgi:sortase (surface protein transpeptidase)
LRYLPDLEPGDEITLYAGNEPYVSVVAEKHIVKEIGVPQSVRQESARWIGPSDDVWLRLVTCAPRGLPRLGRRLG